MWLIFLKRYSMKRFPKRHLVERRQRVRSMRVAFRLRKRFDNGMDLSLVCTGSMSTKNRTVALVRHESLLHSLEWKRRRQCMHSLVPFTTATNNLLGKELLVDAGSVHSCDRSDSKFSFLQIISSR